MFFESLFENLIIKDANMDSNKGIDMHFLNEASELNKDILELESVEFQYNLLLGLPIEISMMNIESYINDYDKSVSEMRNLYEAWKRGNLKELNNLIFSESDEQLTVEQQKLIDDYNNKLIIDRNYNMFNKLNEYCFSVLKPSR